MGKISLLFWRRRDKVAWENPRCSVGERRGSVQDGKFTCWEAVGPVRETWKRLGPQIKDYVEREYTYGPALTIEIYMIGRTEEKAAPKILICSTDSRARKEVRRAICGSGIMDNYSPIGLGDASRLPDLMAQEDIEPTFLPSPDSGEEIIVLSSPLDNAFGRRLFIPRPGGRSLRPTTAGPILHINGNVYQLTAGHAFLEFDSNALPETRASSFDDCDFDGQSDSEEETSSAKDKGNIACKEMATQNSCSPVNYNVSAKILNSFSSGSAHSSMAAISPTRLPSNADSLAANVSDTSDQLQREDLVITHRLSRIGKLALGLETESKQSLDYALVELQGEYRYGNNELPCEPNGTQRWLRVRKIVKEIDSDAKIVTMTASSGLLKGKLCSTASYMRLSSHRTLQELYSVRLDGKLADGDCGSSVVDQVSGDLYGHIVAGSIGTGFAYIVPAMQVFEDIFKRLGDVTFAPVKAKHSKRFPTASAELEPLRLVEFASKQYFSDLEQPTQSSEDDNSTSVSKPVNSIPAPSLVLPFDRRMTGNQGERTISHVLSQPQRQNSQRWLRLLDTINVFRSKTPTHQLNIQMSNVGTKGKGRVCDYPADRKSVTFETRFFLLPSDLQVQIIAFLRVPDILNLRIVSRNWNGLIALNERPISRAFLKHNPIPQFVLSLYPIPDLSEITLRYICEQWHRLFMVSRLSAVMTEWITKDLFLRITDAERLKFLPQQDRMYRRFIPLLFTIFHFFENYRHLHISLLLEQGHGLLREPYTINPIELQIMNMYDNETLLQVHQVFPLLVLALDQKLRPPSYLSRIEKSLRGYHTDPPPPHVHAAILCIGGLSKVTRFLEIEDYEERRSTVDAWYASLSRKSIISELRSREGHVELVGRQSRKAAPSGGEDRTNNITSVSAMISSQLDTRSCCGSWTASKHSRSLVSNTSLAADLPMSPFSPEHAQLLLPDLPTLQEIWLETAEALLLTRRTVTRRQDIKKNAQVMLELIREGITEADKLFYTVAAYNNLQEDK